MPVDIRTIREDEKRAFLDICEMAFGHEIRDDEFEQIARVTEAERSLGAFDGEAMVGTAGAFTFNLSVPGGDVATAGVTMVGVLPTHRRQGILRRLMTEQLMDVQKRGEPLAALWASEAAIYQRFGYGPGSFLTEVSIDRAHATFLRPGLSDARARLLTHAEALEAFPPLYDEWRTSTPGVPSRTKTWWDAHRMRDFEHSRGRAGPMFRILLEIDGRRLGYCMYRVRSDWSDRVPGGQLQVIEAIATSVDATRKLWQYLFGVDLIARIKASIQPIDSPLFLMIEEANYLNAVVHDGLWLRVVDVESALASRSYSSADTMRLEVADDLFESNRGVWSVDGAGSTVTRENDAPDLRLDIAALAAAYLGGFTFTRLLQAGRAEEVTPGAAERADAMFKSARAPYCPEIF